MQRFMASKSWMSMSAATAALAFWMGGCPQAIEGDTIDTGNDSGIVDDADDDLDAPPANQAPSVEAGADLSVEGGALVMLSASASDPEGGALAYLWEQISGEPVVLSDAAVAAPSFTAPMISGAIKFTVTVTDAEGAMASDTVGIEVSVAPMLFASNFVAGGGGVVSFENPAAVNGNEAPHGYLFGPATTLTGPADIVVDRAGTLHVANYAANAITCYTDAATVNGNLAPDRNVQGAATELAGPASLAINAQSDVIFAANYAAVADSIAVFDDASSASFLGNLPPSRRFWTTGVLANPSGINLDAAGSLYVANNAAGNVLVYADAEGLNGEVAQSRTISSAVFAGTSIFDVFVDAQDTLYVVSATVGAPQVFIFNDASTLNGAVMPDVILAVAGGSRITAIVVDAAGTGYIADYNANAIYQYDAIATRNGSVAPDRTISGASTQLMQPIRLFLMER